MRTVLFSVFFLASAWALPKGQNEPLFKRLYVNPSVENISNIIPRIVNGVEAEPHSIPYQAYLMITGHGPSWLCGGSLISPTHVVTAGHCVFGSTSAMVYLGAHNIEKEESTRIIVESRKLICHEDFDEDLISNDIGLIIFDKPVELNKNVNVIQLPSREEVSNYEGVSARVSGWGLIGGSESVSPVLLWVNSTVISNSQCKKVFDIVTDSHICISGKEGGSCYGDSGGPLVYDNFLIGIVSYGSTECLVGSPDGFTRVSSYLDWLEKHTGLKF